MQDEPPARASSKIKELEVMVADVIVETADTSTLVFFTGNDRLVYQAGHFLTIDPHQFETWDDVIFRDTLAQLEARDPGRLKVVHTLTRETNPAVFGPSVRKGRLDTALLKELIPEPSQCFVYLCGPAISKWDRLVARETGTTPQPKFIETALAGLREIGVPDAQIKRESYG